jgi:hypothetical protein
MDYTRLGADTRRPRSGGLLCFAPAELDSAERGFGNQKGDQKITLPAGLSRRGGIWTRARGAGQTSLPPGRAGWWRRREAIVRVLVSKRRSGGASPPAAGRRCYNELGSLFTKHEAAARSLSKGHERAHQLERSLPGWPSPLGHGGPFLGVAACFSAKPHSAVPRSRNRLWNGNEQCLAGRAGL